MKKPDDKKSSPTFEEFGSLFSKALQAITEGSIERTEKSM